MNKKGKNQAAKGNCKWDIMLRLQISAKIADGIHANVIFTEK